VSRLFVALLSVTVFMISGWAQDPFTQELRVELQVPPGNSAFGYSVRLLDLRHFEIGRSYADGLGGFTLRGVPKGDYKLEVSIGSGEVVKEEFVRVTDQSSFVHIKLPEQKQPRPSAERVSVTQLRHPPAKQAVKAFEAARKYSEAGEPERAIAELQKAIRISPDFAEAYTNLAANHIRLKQYDLAIQESSRSMEIGSPNVVNLCNLAAAKWGLMRFEDAIQSANEALRIDGDSANAHFILGSLLTRDPRTRKEGIRHLERAAATKPQAAKHLEAARLQAVE